ncbi:MAG: hypothetical protein M0R06_00030 [Sphaerochaeta sp.]|jgi:hypothetical protein|nr:hypothetical protein [Sphaerochaeta sp.]
MEKTTDDELLNRLNNWVYEAQWVAKEWRQESWRDHEIYDGGETAWTYEDYTAAQEAGIDPLTINRTFPTVNMLIGSQAINRMEIIAKGRTAKDAEIAQVMSESLKFISDQSAGEFIISQSFKDAIIPGFGCIAPALNTDPRLEQLCIKTRDWKEIWWDPYSSPWWNPYKTRYVFWQRWIDLDDFQAIFPEKKKDIEQSYQESAGEWRQGLNTSIVQDESYLVEEKIRSLAASDWVDVKRKRIRPVEMWYPVNEQCLFSLFNDGRCFEIRKDMDVRESYQIISQGQQILNATVKKMRVATFFNRLLLQDSPTPFGHDEFPLVPFLGYIDRYGFPYGVPRQIRGQSEETNKRRSMALALLQKRRVIAERSVAPEGDRDKLNNLYREANKLDGFMVIEDGKMRGFKIEDLANLAAPQIELMRQSELEIREISGVNAQSLGYEGPTQSGVAKNLDLQRSAVTTASLFDNLRRSLKALGEQLACNIQRYWKYEKVLRVTDRLTGAERFMIVNQPQPDGGIKYDITQGRFDIVISEVEATDTVREKNMDLLYAAIEKSPAEAVPTLLMSAFEMSNLPNKELLIEKLKPIFNISPEEEQEDPEKVKQMALQAIEVQKQRMAMQNQITDEMMKQKLLDLRLKNMKTQAEINKLSAETAQIKVETQVEKGSHNMAIDKNKVDVYERGFNIGERMAANTMGVAGKGGQPQTAPAPAPEQMQ